MSEQPQKPMDIQLTNGGIVRVQVLSPRAFRIRLRQDEDFREPTLVRYGIVRNEGRPTACEVDDQEDRVTLRTTEATLAIRKEDGRMTLTDGHGKVLTQDAVSPWSDPVRGFGAELTLADGERLYGLGDVTRDRIQKRGYKTMMWVINVQSYVPIPYIMSDRGWALFLNTTWRHFVDLGHDVPDRLRFWGNRGELDYFLFAGEDAATLLDEYTEVAGKPHMLPIWGYALTFVCNQQADAREMLDDCLNIRREEIPCDVVGLEPGWMETYYDYSVEKTWHPERFYLPRWGKKGPHTFLAAAERMGFKMSLWLCCDYDLSYEEERRVGAAYQQEEERERHPDDFEVDHHFHHPVLMDTITRPDEPWFQHLTEFVDQGVSAFKMDGSRQVNEHPDRKWGNGMDDEEMHNLYPTLLNKQMHVGFKEQTGRRPMVYSSGGYAGIQQFSATWAGDTGGGPKPLISMLNHGMSGHVNTSCDMDVFTPEGIHFGFLQSWSQVCSWAYWRHPWLLGDKLLPIFKHYARLRYRLLPYIYSAAHNAAQTGMPIMRAMSLVFPDDPRSDELINQYMLGDAFLVAVFADQVHLPAGQWIDFWTGERFDGPQEVTYATPAGRGGPLFVRAGAILPTWPDMDYVGQKPVDELGLHVYPARDAATSAFTLHEDDGESFAYLDGAVARTDITCESSEHELTLTIQPRQGEYEGMPTSRGFNVQIHRDGAPEDVQVAGQVLPRGANGQDWVYDAGAKLTRLTVLEDTNRQAPVVIHLTWP